MLLVKEGKQVTWRANSGTGSQEGRPSTRPRDEHSSDMRTGLGAVALYVPLKEGLVAASMYRFTMSSLQHGNNRCSEIDH